MLQALALRPKRLNQQANADTEVRELFEAGHRAFWTAHLAPPPEAAAADAAAAEAADTADDPPPPPEDPEEPEEPLPPGVIDIGIAAGSLLGNHIAGASQPMFRDAGAGEHDEPAGEPVVIAPLKRLYVRNAAVHTNLFQRLCVAVTERFACSRDVLAVAEAEQPHWTVAQQLSQLETLDLSDMPVGNGPLMQFIPAVKQFAALREVRAVNCAMQPLGLRLFCDNMGSPRAVDLTSLDWSDNTVVDGDGATSLRTICYLTGLRELRLQRCGIRAEAAQTLAAALRPLRVLRRLDLARNGLGEAGVAAVVAEAAELPDLAYLHGGAGHGVDEDAARAQLREGCVFELD